MNPKTLEIVKPVKKYLLAIALSSLSLTGCKQGLGERCQVTPDCSDGLVCNEASMVCARPASTDGGTETLPIDAPADSVTDGPVG